MARFRATIKRPPLGSNVGEQHEEDHLHIYGGVFNNAKFGEGFEFNNVAPGTYTVSFTPDSFKGKPGVGCTVYGNTALSVHITELSTSSFTFVISDGGTPQDSGFTFIAFGDAED